MSVAGLAAAGVCGAAAAEATNSVATIATAVILITCPPSVTRTQATGAETLLRGCRGVVTGNETLSRMTSRREFLRTVRAAGVMLLTTRRSQTPGFEGTRAGEERLAAGVRLCWCPPGRFVMGSPPGETGHRSDEAQVPVTFTRGFWMAKFETTQGEWRRVGGGSLEKPPTAEFGLGDDVPVYWVSFIEAERFTT